MARDNAIRLEYLITIEQMEQTPMTAERTPRQTCARCGKKLRSKPVWLEYNQRTNVYCRPGTVPRMESQGAFPLGRDCANRELAYSDDGESRGATGLARFFGISRR